MIFWGLTSLKNQTGDYDNSYISIIHAVQRCCFLVYWNHFLTVVLLRGMSFCHCVLAMSSFWQFTICCVCSYRMAIIKSMELLFLLGALTDGSKLSDPVGRQMARLPLDPIYSKALIVASEFNCLEEMLIVVSMLSVESIHYAPREKLEEVLLQCSLETFCCQCILDNVVC